MTRPIRGRGERGSTSVAAFVGSLPIRFKIRADQFQSEGEPNTSGLPVIREQSQLQTNCRYGLWKHGESVRITALRRSLQTVAEKHPYASPGAVTTAINQFRKSFPTKVSADTLRKLSIAPNNESYVINTLRFIGAIDTEGNKTERSTAAFNLAAFQQAFGKMVQTAYTELFTLHGDAAWELQLDGLISFFRTSDQTSDLVGRRQASTFQGLASLAGHGEVSAPQRSSVKPKEAKQKSTKLKASDPVPTVDKEALFGGNDRQREVGLTVRIEVNLPVAADQETYDRIFRSIRENLLNAK